MNLILNDAQKREYAVMGFGEVMLRLSPVGTERLAQGNQMVKHAGGSELNVVSGISRLGLRAGLISKLPDSPIGRYIRGRIRAYGVSDDYVLDDLSPDARLGVYYYEGGSYPRKPQVSYDRALSSFCGIEAGNLPEDTFGKCRLFHTSGISPALSGQTRKATLELIRKFKDSGAAVSFDVNYRARLWDEDTARNVITEILPMVDVLFISEETMRRMMRMTGTLEEMQRRCAEEYGISLVASTQRTINSPRSHNFTSTIFSAADKASYTEKPYENIEVVDRIGSGDAYVAGVLFGILSGRSLPECLSFGNAVSALKNTISGDMVYTDIDEIQSIIKDHAEGGKSEMNR